MATIHIGRGGKNLGEFSEVEVRRGLRDGLYLPTDLGWRDGMENWRPLSSFEEFSPVAEEPAELEIPEPPSAPWPWERRRERGLIRAFFSTMRLLLRSPRAAFAGMPADQRGAILFLATGVVITSLFLLVGGTAFVHAAARAAHSTRQLPTLNATTLALLFTVGWAMLSAIFLTFALAALLCWTAVVHGCMWIFLRADVSFGETFRLLSFAAGGTVLLLAIPFAGIFLVCIAHLLVVTLGLAALHRQPAARVGVAMLLPTVVLISVILTLSSALAVLAGMPFQP